MRECEESLRSVHSRKASQLDLTTGSQLASRQNDTRVKHAGELKGHTSYSITGQKFQPGQTVSSRLKLMTRSSRELKSPECPIWMKLTLCNPHTLYYKYLYTHEM